MTQMMNKQSARNILFFRYLLAGKKTDLTKKRVFNSEKAKKRSVEKSTIRNISRNSLHAEMFKFVRFMKITSRKSIEAFEKLYYPLLSIRSVAAFVLLQKILCKTEVTI